MRPLQGQCLLALAELAIAQHERDRAEPLLGEARRLFAETSMQSCLRCAQSLQLPH